MEWLRRKGKPDVFGELQLRGWIAAHRFFSHPGIGSCMVLVVM